MLSYLHAFHAGNFADVQKHAALTLALSMMRAKPSAIACFDTHAGSAIYNLDSERARKTAEADAGIQKLWAHRSGLHSRDWQAVIQLLSQFNAGEGPLSVYPGSPAWIGQCLRPGDSLTAFELHPAENNQLVDWAKEQTVRVKHEDGLKGFLKQLPPRQPRLMALIDPSYEVKTEYLDVAQTLQKAWQKCRHGVYLVWYPILTSGVQDTLKQALKESPLRKVWCSEVHLDTPPERGMTGSGMLVVNPPWGFDDRFATMMEDIATEQVLGFSHEHGWLIPE
ncbi:MAG: 23S rRNA (adenine(2030)-N(6))-methyltransferase RlmJ [Marinobacter sp.]|uniref:23S rRNA (adenine(2030)-N(6))-methyltransferase RlmJ n=1 Tax=Marinobacter sp. TaxID=50741 RepID=UPI003F9D39AA